MNTTHMHSIVATQGDKITIEIPTRLLEELLAARKGAATAPRVRAHLSQYRGALKGKITVDPAEYERRVRSEWN